MANENPDAVRAANADLVKRLIPIARGEEAPYDPEEAFRFNHYPNSSMPRLLAEVIETLAAKIAKLEAQNKALRKELNHHGRAIDTLTDGLEEKRTRTCR